MIEQTACAWSTATPAANHSVSRWSRPLIADQLTAE